MSEQFYAEALAEAEVTKNALDGLLVAVNESIQDTPHKHLFNLELALHKVEYSAILFITPTQRRWIRENCPNVHGPLKTFLKRVTS